MDALLVSLPRVNHCSQQAGVFFLNPARFASIFYIQFLPQRFFFILDKTGFLDFARKLAFLRIDLFNSLCLFLGVCVCVSLSLSLSFSLSPSLSASHVMSPLHLDVFPLPFTINSRPLEDSPEVSPGKILKPLHWFDARWIERDREREWDRETERIKEIESESL